MATTESWKNPNGLATKLRQQSDGSLVSESGPSTEAASKACLTPTDTGASIPDNLQLGYKVVFNGNRGLKDPQFKLEFDKDLQPPRWEKEYTPRWREQFIAIEAFHIALDKRILQIGPSQDMSLKAEHPHFEDSSALWKKNLWILKNKLKMWDSELYHLWYKTIEEGQGIPGCPARPRTMAIAAAWAATSQLTTWRSDEE